MTVRYGPLVDRFDRLTADIAQKEDELKTLREQMEELVTVTIPDVLDQDGVSEIKVSDGRTLKLNHVVAFGVPSDDEKRGDPEARRRAFDWLRANGGADIIKNEVVATLDRGQDNRAALIAGMCEEHSIPYKRKEQVHPQTLSKWARERMEEGETVPTSEDGFKVFIGRKAELK